MKVKTGGWAELGSRLGVVGGRLWRSAAGEGTEELRLSQLRLPGDNTRHVARRNEDRKEKASSGG